MDVGVRIIIKSQNKQNYKNINMELCTKKTQEWMMDG